MKRNLIWILSTFLAIIGLLFLVVASPFALRNIAEVNGFRWANLADISQTYDAAGVILTALAFGGVVAALIVQVRDSRSSRESTARTFHLELIRLALDDKTLRAVLMNVTEASDADGRRLLYANLWLAYWQAMFRLGYMKEVELRLYLRQHFHALSGRRQWEKAREFYNASAVDRRTRHFARIVEEEFQRNDGHV